MRSPFTKKSMVLSWLIPVCLFGLFTESGAASKYADAMSSYRGGDYSQVVTLLSEPIATGAEQAESYLILGLAESRLGHSEKAIAALKQVLQINPQHKRGYSNLVRLYYNAGAYDELISLGGRAISNVGGSYHVYNYLGLAYFEKGDDKEAIASFEAAIKLNDASPWAHNNLGLLFLNSNRIADAKGQFTKATKAENPIAAFYNNLGVACEQLHELAAAKAAFAAAIQVDSGYTKAQVSLQRIEKKLAK